MITSTAVVNVSASAAQRCVTAATSDWVKGMDHPSERVEGWKRNTALYKVNSHLYNQNTRYGDKVYLRCVLGKKLGCHGSAILSMRSNMAREKKEHNHGPEKYDLGRLELVNGLKRLAEISSDSLRNVYERAAGEHPLGDTVSFRQIESTLYKRRRLSDPVVPESASELAALLSQEKISGSHHFKAFAEHENDHALIFFSNTVAMSAAEIKYIQLDATFQRVPANYHQLLTIFSISKSFAGHERAFPAFHILMTSDSQLLYVEVFKVLIEVFPDFSPETVVCGLEISSRSALIVTFPGISSHGCFFQYCRSVWKMLKHFELDQCFYGDGDFCSWTKKLLYLLLLPPKDIEKTFDVLCQEISSFRENTSAYERMAAHVRECWINLIGVNELSVFDIDFMTNGTNAHYKCLLRRISGQPPKFWSFISIIARIIDSLERGFSASDVYASRHKQKIKEVDFSDYIVSKDSLQKGIITPMEYLERMGKIFGAYIDEVCGMGCIMPQNKMSNAITDGDVQIFINFGGNPG